MRILGAVTDIPFAGTRVQLSNSADRVYWIKVKAHPSNTGNIIFGDSSVSATAGFVLTATDTVGVELDLRPGSVAMSTFWADTATNGNDIVWLVLKE